MANQLLLSLLVYITSVIKLNLNSKVGNRVNGIDIILVFVTDWAAPLLLHYSDSLVNFSMELHRPVFYVDST